MFASTYTLPSFPLLAVVTSLVPIYSVLKKCLGYGLSSKVPKRKKNILVLYTVQKTCSFPQTQKQDVGVCASS